MNIDGNVVRTDSIDAVTEIEVSVGGVNEGTDKMARGSFILFVRGQRLVISRNKRCGHEKEAGAAAMKDVRAALDEIREPITKVIP